jgi:hypothetical protein
VFEACGGVDLDDEPGAGAVDGMTLVGERHLQLGGAHRGEPDPVGGHAQRDHSQHASHVFVGVAIGERAPPRRARRVGGVFPQVLVVDQELDERVGPPERAVDADLVGLVGVPQHGVVIARKLDGHHPSRRRLPFHHGYRGVDGLCRQIDSHGAHAL